MVVAVISAQAAVRRLEDRAGISRPRSRRRSTPSITLPANSPLALVLARGRGRERDRDDHLHDDGGGREPGRRVPDHELHRARGRRLQRRLRLRRSNYTVTKAPLTVTADDQVAAVRPGQPAADGDAQRLRARPDAGHVGRHRRGGVHDDRDAVQPGRRLPDHVHPGDAGLGELQLRPVRRGHAHGHYSQPCITGAARRRSRCRGAGGLHRPGRRRSAGRSRSARAARSTSRAASSAGSISSTGATAFRMCGAQMSGPVTVSGTTGLVLIGGDAATGPCAGNSLTGPVSITGNSGGVEFNGEPRRRLARDHGQHGQRPAAGHRRGARGRQHGRRPEHDPVVAQAERGEGAFAPPPRRGYVLRVAARRSWR